MSKPLPTLGRADASHLGMRIGDQWWVAAPYEGWKRSPDPQSKFLEPQSPRRRWRPWPRRP